MADINLLALEINRALGVLQVTTGNQTFNWNNADYVCVPHKQDANVLFGAGGFTPNYALELDVQQGTLPDPGPKPPDFLYFPSGGKKYRIVHVVTNPDLSIRITCNDPDRGSGIKEFER